MRNEIRKSLKLQESRGSLDARLAKYPKTRQHLLQASRRAEMNTGELDGEYGTYHHIEKVSPSKQQAELEHALVHHTATRMGPDMAYEKTGRLTAKVRKVVPDIVQAFEDGKLEDHMSSLVHGSDSDQYRHSGDKYF